jgi:hypothetical protein
MAAFRSPCEEAQQEELRICPRPLTPPVCATLPPRARAHVQFGKPLVSQVTTKLEANKKTTKSAKTCVSARARTPRALVAGVRSLPPCAHSCAHTASGVPLPADVPLRGLRELRAAGVLQRQHVR